MLANVVVIAAMLMGMAMIPGVAISQETFRVTLVGTGTPTPHPQRLGPATLVEVGNQTLLFDAGRGVPVRFSQLGIPMARIDALFITHYHSDHVSGIPDLWLTGWLPAGGQRKQPFRVIGPTGAKELMTNLERAYAADVRGGRRPLPPEFKLTGTSPDDWQADDVVRIRSHALVSNVTSEVARARVHRRKVLSIPRILLRQA